MPSAGTPNAARETRDAAIRVRAPKRLIVDTVLKGRPCRRVLNFWGTPVRGVPLRCPAEEIFSQSRMATNTRPFPEVEAASLAINLFPAQTPA
jgi:hypothetical protein